MSSSRMVHVLCVTLMLPALALAQGVFPNKPVRLVVPYAAGTVSTIAFRMIGEELEGTWKQPLIADYKPGAGGRLAFETVAKSSPDGHTLASLISSLTTLPYLVKDLTFDPQRDIVGVEMLLRY